MFSATEPAASKIRPEEQRGSIQILPDMVTSNITQDHRNDWADTDEQVDYFVSAGFNNDSIYNSWSISPLRSSGSTGRHANAAGPHAKSTYPSQELNPRYGSLQLSPPTSDGGMKPPPLPPPLPPPKVEGAGGFCAEEVPSIKTSTGPSPQGIKAKFRVDEVISVTATGLTQDLNDLSTQNDGLHSNDIAKINELDSFELGGVDTDSIAKTGGIVEDGIDEDNFYKPIRVSTSPPKESSPSLRAAKSRKKTNGKAKKKISSGIASPADLDILRGRGGLTNRHPGNMRFRDEARHFRAEYRDYGTSRQEKFLLSQDLLQRVRAEDSEKRVLINSGMK